jgi:hypothetical protein
VKDLLKLFGFMAFILGGLWLGELLGNFFTFEPTLVFFGLLFFFMIRSIYRDRRK